MQTTRWTGGSDCAFKINVGISTKLAILTNNNEAIVLNVDGKWVTYKALAGGVDLLVNSNGFLILRTNDSIYLRDQNEWLNLKVHFDKPYGEPKQFSNRLLTPSLYKIGILMKLLENGSFANIISN
ncbi:hypothetical protein [Paenibacillus sp.]|uniref:hypothetical protein n=1 Tax=Paenibacillus sp. TaxID=58172 RepID=UPI002819CEBD|nr:hypothetical protein [Paenibacillus sp.]MDR0266574.1 hypothetical protein [Paenibacillus sp.]